MKQITVKIPAHATKHQIAYIQKRIGESLTFLNCELNLATREFHLSHKDGTEFTPTDQNNYQAMVDAFCESPAAGDLIDRDQSN